MNDSSVVLLLITILILTIGYPVAYYGSSEVINITVTEKERIMDRESSRYLIFTETEVFENTDSILYFKFNSSDVYAKLEADQSYTVQVAGWRIPFLSSYRNIITVQ